MSIQTKINISDDIFNDLKIQIINKINSIKPLTINENQIINDNIINEYIKNKRDKYIILITDDNKYFMVKKELLICSGLLKELLENNDGDMIMIPININSKITPYILCYMDHHHHKLTNEIEKPIVDKFMDIASISNWDKQFVCTIIDENENINDLFIDCLNASNFLSITSLCNLLCARFACSIGLIDMTVETLRNILGETNDLTSDDEKKISDELKFIENSYSDRMNKFFLIQIKKMIVAMIISPYPIMMMNQIMMNHIMMNQIMMSQMMICQMMMNQIIQMMI